MTGVQPNNGTTTISFIDSGPQSFVVSGTVSAGGVAFAGFTDSGALITSVTITATNAGQIGFDDVRFAVPEPATWALVAGGLLALAGIQRVRRRKAALLSKTH